MLNREKGQHATKDRSLLNMVLSCSISNGIGGHWSIFILETRINIGDIKGNKTEKLSQVRPRLLNKFIILRCDLLICHKVYSISIPHVNLCKPTDLYGV